MRHPLLGSVAIDPIGEALNTGFMRFENAAVRGLAKWTDARLDLLAIVSMEPGRGNVREFIRQAKRYWPEIVVFEVFNPALKDALARYGFAPIVMTSGDHVMRWAEEVPADG